MRIYMCFDPGGTTGYAQINHNLELLSWGQIPDGINGFIQWMDREYDSYTVTDLLCENFVFRRRKENLGADLTPLEIIGALKMFTEERDIDLTFLPPGAHENVAQEVPEHLGYMVEASRSRNVHQMDAARHILNYLRMKKHREVLKLCQQFPKMNSKYLSKSKRQEKSPPNS